MKQKVIILRGPSGVGKSSVASLLAKSLRKKTKRLAYLPVDVNYLFVRSHRSLSREENGEIVLRKSINKWKKEDRKNKDKRGLKMALDMEKIVFRKDFGGEYFICPSKFESYIKKAKLKIKKKLNVTNKDPLDMENYLFVIIK